MARPVQKLAQYPYVIVRIGCDLCGRKGQYRLARLAAKFGAEIELDELIQRLAADCAGWDERHPIRQICEARFIDLTPPRRPPDNPALVLKVVAGGKADAPCRGLSVR